jgi:hypothetical protein
MLSSSKRLVLDHPTRRRCGHGFSGRLHDNRSTPPLGACLRIQTHIVWLRPPANKAGERGSGTGLSPEG